MLNMSCISKGTSFRRIIEEYELLQEEVLKLKEENEVFRAREKDFDIRDLKEKLKATR